MQLFIFYQHITGKFIDVIDMKAPKSFSETDASSKADAPISGLPQMQSRLKRSNDGNQTDAGQANSTVIQSNETTATSVVLGEDNSIVTDQLNGAQSVQNLSTQPTDKNQLNSITTQPITTETNSVEVNVLQGENTSTIVKQVNGTQLTQATTEPMSESSPPLSTGPREKPNAETVRPTYVQCTFAQNIGPMKSYERLLPSVCMQWVHPTGYIQRYAKVQ